MKIYLELLIPFILIFMFLIWKVWFSWSKRRLSKKYNPDNDKGRKGELRDREFERTEPEPRESVSCSDGFNEPEGREFLQETNVNSVRKNSSIAGNLLKKFRNNRR